MFFLPISPRDGKQKGRVNNLMVKQLKHLQDEKLDSGKSWVSSHRGCV